MDRKALDRPALSEWETLDVDVLQTPLVEPLHGPVRGSCIARSAGRAWPEPFGQPPMRVHGLGLRHRLAANPRDGGVVHAGALSAQRDRDRKKGSRKNNKTSHGAILARWE